MAAKRNASQPAGTPPKRQATEDLATKALVVADAPSLLDAAIVSGHQPLKPVKNAPRAEWAVYYEDMAKYVLHHLKGALAVAGVNIDELGELHHVPPTKIVKNAKSAIGGAQLTTFQETWDVENCKIAMTTTGKYSAPGSLWWFDLVGGKVVFQGETIFETEPDPAAVDAAGALWDDAAYFASDLVEKNRRYNFPATFPTACTSLSDVEQTLKSKGFEGTPTFKSLPMVAGRAVVLAFLLCMADSIETMVQLTEKEVPAATMQAQKIRLEKLFEARKFLWISSYRAGHLPIGFNIYIYIYIYIYFFYMYAFIYYYIHMPHVLNIHVLYTLCTCT